MYRKTEHSERVVDSYRNSERFRESEIPEFNRISSDKAVRTTPAWKNIMKVDEEEDRSVVRKLQKKHDKLENMESVCVKCGMRGHFGFQCHNRVVNDWDVPLPMNASAEEEEGGEKEKSGDEENDDDDDDEKGRKKKRRRKKKKKRRKKKKEGRKKKKRKRKREYEEVEEYERERKRRKLD